MRQVKSNSFFYILDWFSKLCGVWFPNKNETKFERILYSLWNSLFLSVSIIFFICEVLVMKNTISQLQQFVRYIGMLFSHVAGLAKFFVLTVFQRRINNIKDVLQDEIYDYEDFGAFQPGKFITESKALADKIIILLSVMYAMVGGSAHIAAVINLNTHYHEEYFNENVTCYDFLPYVFVIPFPTPTKSSCKQAIAFMDVGLGIFACYIGCYDAMFSILLICVKTKFHILYGASRTIRERTLIKMKLPVDFKIFRDEYFPELEDNLYHEIRKCAKHLDSLLWACESIESIFNYTVLLQILASLLVIASNLYVSSQISITDPEMFSIAEYMSVILTQLFMICYFGNEITEASSKISFSLYDGDWFSSSKRFKKCMMLMMSRLHRKVHVTIGKFSPLTLATFIGVIRGSFSYYTLFRAVDKN